MKTKLTNMLRGKEKKKRYGIGIITKDSDAGRDWGQEEKGTTEDEVAGWHHRLHGRESTRLPHPWDSPGKNTGVGCHFLLQCMKVKSKSEVAQSCLILHDPMVCRPPDSSIHGIFQARVLEWSADRKSVM